jgi:hypothetical protein
MELMALHELESKHAVIGEGYSWTHAPMAGAKPA